MDKSIALLGSGSRTVVTTTTVVSANDLTVEDTTFSGRYNNSTSFAWNYGGIITRKTEGATARGSSPGPSTSETTEDFIKKKEPAPGPGAVLTLGGPAGHRDGPGVAQKAPLRHPGMGLHPVQSPRVPPAQKRM